MTHVIFYEQNLMSCDKKKKYFNYNFKECEKILTKHKYLHLHKNFDTRHEYTE